MLKKFLTIVLPLALPFIVYGVYLLLARRKARLKQEGRLPSWQDAPWSWIIVCSVLLVAVALGAARELSGVKRTEPFLPPSSGTATVDSQQDAN